MKKCTDSKSFMAAHARKAVVTALLAAGCAYYDLASAATLPTGATLSITGGSVKPTKGTYSGSYFGMDSNGDSSIPLTELTAINGTSYFSNGAACNSTILSGLISSAAPLPIGSASLASGSHTGCPAGTESPAADIWVYFGNTGMDYLATAATDNGNGTLAWSGWTVTWNGIAAIPMNSRAWQPGNCDDLWLNCTGWTFNDSAARIQWSGTSGGVWSALNGAAYTLDYTATVPNSDPSGFDNVKYYLHLVGTVTLPAFTLADDSAIAKTATAKTISVTANDTQTNYVIDSSSVAIASGPSHGTAVANAGNTITYTSSAAYTGTDSFTYTVTGGGITSSAATVTITVSSALPPTANADTATASGTTATTITVLSNDTAGDNAISTSTVAISTAASPSHGTATANSSGTITYTAASGFSGVDTFKYTVRDTAANTSNAATVSVTIRATAPASASGTLSPGTTATAAGGTPATTGDGLTTSNVGADSALSQQCVGGCFDFSISGLSAGSSVKVVLPLSAAIPANAVYRKKSASGTWGDFSSASGNAVASAAFVTGTTVCPEAGSSSYTSGLTEGNRCVQLTIVEGGANDADSVTTTISDPSGVGVKGASVDLRSGATGGCSLGSSEASLADRGEWWLVLGFVAWLGMVIRRRQSRA